MADAGNHRIIRIHNKWRVYIIRQFGKKGKGKGELNGPKGIAIDSNDIVYVSECGNHRISIFTKEGEAIWHTSGHMQSVNNTRARAMMYIYANPI